MLRMEIALFLVLALVACVYFSYCREALRLQIMDDILKPVNYEEFGACIDGLKISLFERRAAAEPVYQEERAMGIAGCLPRCSKSPRALPRPSTGAISWMGRRQGHRDRTVCYDLQRPDTPRRIGGLPMSVPKS